MSRSASRSHQSFLNLGQKSIRVQLALLVLGIVLPAFAVAVVYLWRERDDARDAAREKVDILAATTVQRLENRLREYTLLLTYIAGQPELRALAPGRCQVAVQELVRQNPEYIGMGTRDLEGNSVCAYRSGALSREQMQTFPWFQRALESGQFAISDAVFTPNARRWATMLTMPILDAAGRPGGLLILPLDLREVSQRLLGSVPANAVVIVMDADYRILMRSKDPEKWIGQPIPPATRRELEAGRSGLSVATGADGVERLSVYRSLSGTGWRVSAGIPLSEVYADADADLRDGILACVAMLLASMLVAWRLASAMVRPLDALARIAARVAGGELDARAPALSGAAEFAAVGRGFNEMLDARARADAALRRSEQNLSVTLESIGDGVIATDMEGRILRMNATAQRLTGWGIDEALGRPLEQVFRTVDARTREPLADAVQRVLVLGETVVMANAALLLARDGAEYQISDTAAPIRDRDGTVLGVILVFSDVSRQYAVQSALNEAYSFTHQVLMGMPHGLNVRDMQRRYREWNPAMERIAAMTRAQVLGRTMEDVYPDQPGLVRDAINDATGRAETGEVVVRPDTPLRTPSGIQWTTSTHSPLRNASGAIIGTLAVVQDITERKLAEQALRASEENLSITLQSIGDGVIATDADGRVTRMNPVAEQMTGWPLQRALGQPLGEVFQIVDTESRERSPDPVQRVLAAGEVVGLANHTSLRSRDGLEYQIADSAAPIRDASGRILGVVLVFSNVSERYRLQREVAENELRYRALVESSPVGVAVLQDDLVKYANPMAMEILGASLAEELVGRPFLQFVHPDDHPSSLQRARAMRDGGLILPMLERRHVRLDGRVIDTLVQGRAIEVGGRHAVQISIMDITERKRIERRVQANEERFRALTELSADWYWEQDAQFRFVRMDASQQSPISQFSGDVVGKTHWELTGHAVSVQEWEHHREVLRAHKVFRDFQMRTRGPNGDEVWVSISGAPIFDADGSFQGYRGVSRDITAQKFAADQIHVLAFYDVLTDLPNRRLLIEQLKKAVQTHARTHRQAALLFIDLDNFKMLNDTMGHETGDELLRQVARRLVSCVREADTVARLGGDEFVVMLEDLSDNAQEAALQAESVGTKILAAFGPSFELDGRSHRSTPSIGITLFGKGNPSVDDLLKHADLAMYQAKGAGRNTLRIFDEGMQAAVDGRAALEGELRDALAHDQMRLHYQPIVQLNGQISGAEALVRWQHPQRGMVLPGEFIGLAESTRLIIPLGRWVLHTAGMQLHAWQTDPAMAALTLAVNVSAQQFKDPDFVSHVTQALEQTGANPRQLKIELTESLLAHSVEDVIAKMTALRALGIAFSLDDFGTGYSSLSYLKRLPLTQLKIDQSFVRDVLDDPNDAAIARTIVALGGTLGLSVIAEGVETPGQHQFLRDIGCHAFQGYLFGRPMPVAELNALVHGQRPREHLAASS